MSRTILRLTCVLFVCVPLLDAALTGVTPFASLQLIRPAAAESPPQGTAARPSQAVSVPIHITDHQTAVVSSATAPMSRLTSEELHSTATLQQLQTAADEAERATQQFLEGSSAEIPDATQQAELKRLITVAFEARQELQRAEISDLKSRLERLQRHTAARDQFRDRIIERRVEELLHPALRWNEIALDSDVTQGVIKSAVAPVRSVASPAAAPSHELDGIWEMVSITGPGILGHEQGLLALIHGAQWTMIRGQFLTVNQLAIDEHATPKRLAMSPAGVPANPSIWRGIYRVEGDRLIIHFGENDTLPSSFNDPTANIHTWRRLKLNDSFKQ